MKRREDALAYITHEDRLLVFWEPDFPDAPIQPPGGGLRPGEAPEEAVVREAREERPDSKTCASAPSSASSSASTPNWA